MPAQYRAENPAAVMVFQDGGGYTARDGNNPTLNVLDDLMAQKKIPVMIAVFINPGRTPEPTIQPPPEWI